MGPEPYGCYNGSLCKEFGVDVMRKKKYCDDRRPSRKQSHRGDLQFRSYREGKESESVKKKTSSIIDTSNLNGRSEKAMIMGLVSRSLVELEPGELCSEDSSGIEDVFRFSEGKVDASSGRKRKLSPIDHIKDEGILNRDCRKTYKNKERASISLHSHSSFTLRASEPTSIKEVRKSESLFADQRISIDFIQESHVGNENEPKQMTKDYVTVSTYSFSRWANANGSFEDDECAISDVEFSFNRRKSMLLASAQDQRAEHGEVIFKEGSERSTFNASGSVGSCREDCLEPMKDGISYLDEYTEDSNVGVSNGSLQEEYNAYILGDAESPCRTISMLQACRNVVDFDKLNKINEGAYGTVYRARDKKTGEIVALKKVKMQKEREGFPITSLREITILLSLHHPSIVEVKEVVVGRDLDDIFIVMEYMEHDLKCLLGAMKKPFHLSEVKCLMLQLLGGVKHLHDNWVLHRDLKMSNILFNNCGELKICDFGLSRQYGSPLKLYTKLVVTLWYRAPELLLGANGYSTAIDMWSVGCMMAELLNMEPLFPGKGELDQLDKIFRILGTPDEDIWPGLKKLPGAKVDFIKKPFKLHEKFPRMSSTSVLGRPMLSNAGFDLLNKLLTYDPEKRITAEDAIDHPWFRESPLPMSKDFMPTFPAQHTKGRQLQRLLKGPYPLEQIIRLKDSQYLDACSSLDNRKLMVFFSNNSVMILG